MIAGGPRADTSLADGLQHCGLVSFYSHDRKSLRPIEISFTFLLCCPTVLQLFRQQYKYRYLFVQNAIGEYTRCAISN